MRSRKLRVALALGAVLLIGAGIQVWLSLRPTQEDDTAVARACADVVTSGLRPIAETKTERFLGKVDEARARCRGGERAIATRSTPWVDWANYWGTGDSTSKSERFLSRSHIFNRAERGVDGALLELEYQRMELIRFNLFDNNTFEQYLGHDGGAIKKVWPELRLAREHPDYPALRVDSDGAQTCQGGSIRFRTTTGVCNDIKNPAMGATGQLFARNVAFEATYPDLGLNEQARNRHGDRIGLLKPDPQVISRRLLTRDQATTPNCNHGRGVPNSDHADCSYKKAPFFNVLAAFWIQFMTHDWFSHLKEARNDQTKVMTELGCSNEIVKNDLVALSPERIKELGCRPDDKMEAALFADVTPPGEFKSAGGDRLKRTPKTTQNQVTAWWDASQMYGWDEPSRRRVRRDPADRAKLLLETRSPGQSTTTHGLLPVFRNPCAGGTSESCDPMQPEWTGQEAVAFPDNWSLGLSFFHNVFAREHNAIIDEFRKKAREHPDLDSGLRSPESPDNAIPYAKMSDDELFEIARLIVAAEIAKIHTIEWTTQLLYNEPLNAGMNSNWSGLFKNLPITRNVTKSLLASLQQSKDSRQANELYSAFIAGSGIFGRGNARRYPSYLPDWISWDQWSIKNPDDVNGGINHFGSPFNFPEDFPSVYRLHAMVPDMLEFRRLNADPNKIQKRVPTVETFRGKATPQLRDGGLADWALTLGRQRVGLLVLQNHPQFLQNLNLRPRMDSMIDVPALDIIRDRERGTPRFNEFRRQIGLRQLTSFDDFIDVRLPADSPELADQKKLVAAIREVYGQHRCDASRIITDAQFDHDGKPVTDCLGQPDGSMVDNIEDVDLLVGFHAETTRPHGFAISETQFHIFILNASRRLFSDRFFTSSFRPEFYTHLGVEWVMNNGPTGTQWEQGEPNGHKQEVSPLKRLLLRVVPELREQLAHVVNVFDPWARDRGEYYSLQWKPRPEAASDPSFQN